MSEMTPEQKAEMQWKKDTMLGIGFIGEAQEIFGWGSARAMKEIEEFKEENPRCFMPHPDPEIADLMSSATKAFLNVQPQLHQISEEKYKGE